MTVAEFTSKGHPCLQSTQDGDKSTNHFIFLSQSSIFHSVFCKILSPATHMVCVMVLEGIKKKIHLKFSEHCHKKKTVLVDINSRTRVERTMTDTYLNQTSLVSLLKNSVSTNLAVYLYSIKGPVCIISSALLAHEEHLSGMKHSNSYIPLTCNGSWTFMTSIIIAGSREGTLQVTHPHEHGNNPLHSLPADFDGH